MLLRALILCLLAATLGAWAERAKIYPDVTAGYGITFPKDEGSHPNFRTEWWYVTGWIRDANQHERGFQVTFFRARPDGVAQDNPSKFSPQQILFAHAALSDPAEKKLLHAQRAARAGFGLAQAETEKLNITIHPWYLHQTDHGYRAQITSGNFSLDLAFAKTQSPMLNGKNGYSQKSPNPLAASYYYSIPQLAVTGSIIQNGKRYIVTGTAWLDHEWSSEYLDPRASGWDWSGINFDDGGALMVFRMRDQAGNTLWAGGTYRDARGVSRELRPDDIEFKALEVWQSPRTGGKYPIACTVRAGDQQITLEPLLKDQELDSGSADRAVYWEGAVRALRDAKQIGRGYLELTGYASPLKF